MPDLVESVNGVRIRLTLERWEHIQSGHEELRGLRDAVLKTIAEPESVRAGTSGELLAYRVTPNAKLLVVVYREEAHDGFVITAFVTRRRAQLDRRPQIWPP